MTVKTATARITLRPPQALMSEIRSRVLGIQLAADRDHVKARVSENSYIVDLIDSALVEKRAADVVVRNPWSKELVAIDPDTVTQTRLDALAHLMDDEIRETLHNEWPPCTPGWFWRRYVDIVGPDAAGRIWFA